jgi:hypothetical protein
MKCDHCPVDGPCRAQWPGWGFLCRTAAGGLPSDLVHIRTLSATEPGTIVESAPSLEPAPPPVPLAEAIRATRLGFRHCLYSSHEGCGCSGAHCYYRGRVVTLRDCLDCLNSPLATRHSPP